MAFVLKGYPRLSETFIAQEILALERRGLDIVIYSLRHPTDTARHPSHRQIRAPLRYLPEYLYQEPWRILRALWRQSRRPGFGRALVTWWRDLRRDRTANRIRRFGQALVLADELAPGIDWLYAHFPAHAGLSRPLRQPADRAALELLGPCQGHLDDSGVGEA